MGKHPTSKAVTPGHDAEGQQYVCVSLCVCVLFFTFLFIYKDIKTINRSSASAWMHCWPPQGGGLTSKEVRSLGWQLAHHCMSWASASDMNHGGVAIKDALMRRRVSADGQALLRRMNPAPPSSANSSTFQKLKAFMYPECLVAMATIQTPYWKEFSLKWPI